MLIPWLVQDTFLLL